MTTTTEFARLTKLVYKPGALTPSECVEYDRLIAAEEQRPSPRFKRSACGVYVDVSPEVYATAKPVAKTAPKAPAADREAEVGRRLAALTARRNLSRDELGEVERLRTEARKLEIKRRGY